MSIEALNEAEATAVIERGIKTALRKMSDYLARQAALGEVPDLGYLNAVRRDLQKIASAHSVKIVKGDWKSLMVEGMELGAQDVATFAAVDPQLLKLSLTNQHILIKDLLMLGPKSVNGIISSAIVSGSSLREISTALHESLEFGTGAISKARADMIASNELFSVYRQSKFKESRNQGFECFQMSGPDDSRISEICEEHLGKTLTAAEWLNINGNVFSYGLHISCRHDWLPTECPEGKGDNKKKEGAANAV